MNKKLFQSGKSLLSKLCLTSLLLIGMGNTAWADTVVVDGSTIADGWTNGGAKNFTASTGNISYAAQAFLTTTSGQISAANTYSWYSLSSDEAISMTSERTIEIGVKSMNDYGGELIVRYSADGTNFTNAADITTEIRSNDAMASFNTLTIDNIPEGDQYIQIIGKAIYINSIVITGDAAVLTTPKLKVSPSSIDFGSLRANASQIVTVTNAGVGTMAVTINNDNATDFTLSATELSDIGEGESKTFDITFNYNSTSLGEKIASITVTPNYNAEAAINIAVTATAASLDVWEDFDDGIPSTWYNEDDYWLNYVSGLSGYASPGYNSDYILRTPRLYAEEGEALGFDVKIVGKYSSNVVTASYSTDRVNWSSPVTYSADGTYSITAPATGYYWVKFTASQAGIDNMTGWALAPVSHETVLGTATIPSTGTVHGDYTAKVDVMELGGSDEDITAELYFGETKVAEETMTIGGNRDVTVTLTYLPTEPFSGNVYIKVSGENIGTLETAPVAVSITETEYVFDENSDVNPVISSSSVVKVIYTARKGWNTICMPFSLSGSPAYMNTIFGEGWTAYAINSYDNGHLTFKSTTYMATTTPFLVYAPNAESHPDGVYLQNVSAGSYNWSHTNINQTVGDATFKGTFAPIDAPGMEGKYGVTPKGQIMNGNSSANIKAYHAYFELATAPAKLTIEIDENDAPTLIGAVQMMEDNAAVYDMMGRKVETLNGKVVSGQLPKGIYIVNGKKVIVK